MNVSMVDRIDISAVAVLAPLGAWVLGFMLVCRRVHDTRVAFLCASVIWGSALVFLTELLSLFDALNYGHLVAGWLLLVLLSLLIFGKQVRQDDTRFINFIGSNQLIILPVFAILSITLLIALISPPNTFDSMTYHMPRVMHWIQNGSVKHYPTNILRQIEMNPWAEYAIMHLQSLSGGDYLANLVQWFSFLGCIVGVSLIAALFSANSSGQALAALVAATIPMAILQASSTQNDLAVAFWLVCFVYFGMRSVSDKSMLWPIMMSCSLGLAILTKGTAYIFALPFVVWFAVRTVRFSGWQNFVKLLMLGVIALALNCGHYYRNYSLFHHPLHSGTSEYVNAYMSAGMIASNTTKNIVMHLMTPVPTLNLYIVGIVRQLHIIYGVELDDTATTWPGTLFEQVRLAPHEDTSGNPLHLCLFLVAGSVILISRTSMRGYAVAIMAAFLLFCILLRWQPWHSRLHLPLFILFAPLVGTVMVEMSRNLLVCVLIWILCLAALPWLLCNVSRPLISLKQFIPCYPDSILSVSRQSLYFANRPLLENSYRVVAEEISRRGVKNIALDTRGIGNSWEYPLWVLTRTFGLSGPRIEHVAVNNVSSNILRSFIYESRVLINDDGKLCPGEEDLLQHQSKSKAAR